MEPESHLKLLNKDHWEVKIKYTILPLVVNENISVHFLLDKSERLV